MHQKSHTIWILAGVLFLLFYGCAAFYVILQIEPTSLEVWKDEQSNIVLKLKEQETVETVTSKDASIHIQTKEKEPYTFPDENTCVTKFTKEMELEGQMYLVDGGIEVDFVSNEVVISTKINEWNKEKNRYEFISIGYNTYSLSDITQPIIRETPFVDGVGKAMDQHRDIEKFIGFDQVQHHIKQMDYYHKLITAIIEEQR